MAANVGNAYITIVPSMKGAAAKITSELGGVDGSGAGRKVGSSFSSGLSAKAAGIMGAVSALTSKAFDTIANSLDSAISRVDTLNNYPRVMESMGYSSDEATVSLEKMGAAIDGLPTSLDSLASMTQQLAPLCGGLDEATDLSIAMNNALLAGGKGTAEANRAIVQYTQALGKGKFELEDFRTLQEVIPGQLTQIARSMLGASASSMDLYEAMKSGEVSMDDFNDAIIRLNEEGGEGFASFEEQACAATVGIGTALDNAGNRTSKAVGTIIEAIGSERIANAINSMTSQFVPMAEVIAPAFTFAADTVEAGIGKIGDIIKSAVQIWDMGDTISQKLETMFLFAKIEIETGAAELQTKMGEVWAAIVDSVPPEFQSTFETIGTTVDMLVTKAGGLTGIVPYVAGAIGAFMALQKVPGIMSLVGSGFSALSGIAGTASSGFGVAKGFIDRYNNTLELGYGKNIAFNNSFGRIPGMLSGLASPVGIAVAAIAALAGGFVYFYTTNDGFRDSINGIVSAMGESLAPILQSIGETLTNFATAVLPIITSLIQQMAPVILEIITYIVQIAAALAPLIAQIVASLLPAITSVLTVVISVVSTIIATVLPIIATIISALTPVITTIASIMIPIIQTLGTVVSTIFSVIQTVITTVMSVIQSIIVTVMAAINGDWSGVWSAISGLASSVWESIKSFISTGINNAKTTISNVLGNIKSKWNEIWSSIKDKVSEIWDGIKQGVSDGIDAAYNTVKGLKDKVTGFFADAGSWLIDSGKSLLEGLATGVQNAIGTVTSKISGAIEDIRGLFPFSPAKYGPFSGHGYTTYSGKALMSDFAASIEQAAPAAARAANNALAGIQAATEFDVSARYAPAGYGADSKVRPGTYNAGNTYNLYIDGAKANANGEVMSLVEQLVTAATTTARMGV